MPWRGPTPWRRKVPTAANLGAMALELLAPAKNADQGILALRCGADAVYMGGPQFGARQAAGNSLADFEQVTREARLWDAKVFATLNTILFDAELEAARRQALLHLLREDCGACHGLTLQGGLGSPLTAAALAGKPEDSMVATLLNGRPGTAMPPWWPFLSEDEARWLIRQLQQGATP